MISLWVGISAMQLLQKGLKAYSCLRIKRVIRLCFPQENFRVSMNGENTSRGLPWRRDSCGWWCGLKLEMLQLWQPPSWFMNWRVHWKTFKGQMHCSCSCWRVAADSSSLSCIQGNNLWNTFTWFINFLCSKQTQSQYSDLTYILVKPINCSVDSWRTSGTAGTDLKRWMGFCVLALASTCYPLCNKFSFLVQEEFANCITSYPEWSTLYSGNPEKISFLRLWLESIGIEGLFLGITPKFIMFSHEISWKSDFQTVLYEERILIFYSGLGWQELTLYFCMFAYLQITRNWGWACKLT